MISSWDNDKEEGLRLILVLNQQVTADLIIPVLDRENKRTTYMISMFTKFEHGGATKICLVK